MTKKLLLIFIFFGFCPILLLVSFFCLLRAEERSRVLGSMVSPNFLVNRLYAALPANPPEISTEIKAEDARCLLIENYLLKYNSPLVPYSQVLCQTALKYELDYRLLVAIAQQESNLCKTSPPEWHNCWGWGIHSRGTKKYDTYEEAIEDVARGIKVNYCDKGYCDDPCVMMKKYTPQSNGSWCYGINKFLAEIEQSS